MKTFLVAIICSSLTILNPTIAAAGLMTIQDVTHRNGTLSQEIIQKIDTPEVQKKLADLGLDSKEAKQRIAALSDQEIKDMINSKSQAGGDVVVISLTTILLVVIIVLLLR